MRISDWSSDVCSSDLQAQTTRGGELDQRSDHAGERERLDSAARILAGLQHFGGGLAFGKREWFLDDHRAPQWHRKQHAEQTAKSGDRSEEHTSELQSLLRISYAVFCLKKKKSKYKYNIIR